MTLRGAGTAPRRNFPPRPSAKWRATRPPRRSATSPPPSSSAARRWACSTACCRPARSWPAWPRKRKARCAPARSASPGERRLFLEQLAHLEGDTHRALDLQLAGHVGHGRVELPGDEVVEIIEADGDRRLGVARGVVDERRRLRPVPEDHAVAAEIELNGMAERRRRAGLGPDGGSGAFEGHRVASP